AEATRLARRVFEHRPHELRLVVNGFLLGVQRISGGVNDVAMTVNPQEPIALVEVFSEQAVCLAALDIDAPPGRSVEQAARVDLSDGRSVEISIAFTAPWPTVRAVYRDPWLAISEPPGAESANPRNLKAPAQTQPALQMPKWLLAQLRPRTWRARLALAALGVWLLVFTPGTKASAASRIFDLARRAGTALMRLINSTAPPMSSNPTKAPAPGLPTVAPAAPRTSPPS